MASSVSKPINCLREDGGWLDQQRDDEVTDGISLADYFSQVPWLPFTPRMYFLAPCFLSVHPLTV